MQDILLQLVDVIGERRQQQAEQQQPVSETGQDDAQHGQPLVQPTVEEVPLNAFTKLNPLTFSDSDIHEDPQTFIDEVSWICQGLGCSPTRMVQFATFRLHDVARGWYTTMLLA